MATIKVNPEQLGDAVEKILKEYFDGIETESTRLVSEVAAETVADLMATSPKHTGRYARSWRVKQTKKQKGNNEVTVYNTNGQLSHLLEFGHIKNVHGKVLGFTAARPHIGRAEAKAKEKLVDGLRVVVERGAR